VRRLLVRWLTRRSRLPPALRATAAVLLGAAAVAGLAAPSSQGQTSASTAVAGGAPAGVNQPSKSPDPPGPGDPVQTFPDSAALRAEGYTLYEGGCSSCHGIALQGTPGVAPSLRGVGAGPVDFYLATGRMPLEQPRVEPMRNPPEYNRSQRIAIVDFVASYGGPPAPTANPANGSLALGLHEFTLNCAGCHQEVARGGLTVDVPVPNLLQVTPVQIAEAVRMGPYVMPHFDYRQINQHQLDSIARYVLWTRHPNNAGGWGIDNLGPIPEGIVAWFLALAAMVLVARLIGERLA
jgi:ubiquinol-cytochrome c reductase cytochrome c subunit